MAKFNLGRVMSTRGVMAEVNPIELIVFFRRHAVGDWGKVCEDDRAENERALTVGNRLMSVYETKDKKTTVWVITEADRSVTTALLPSEY